MVGKKPIELPQGVTVLTKTGEVSVTGAKGSLLLAIPGKIEIKVKEGKLFLEEDKMQDAALLGTTRARLANAVLGVSAGWEKKLELGGTGFRAEVNGQTLVLTIGYSHPVKIEAPEGISFKVEKNIVTIAGLDKEVVGQIAALARAQRPPEPYQGKGIKYIDEIIRRKPGKAAKTVGAGTA